MISQDFIGPAQYQAQSWSAHFGLKMGVEMNDRTIDRGRKEDMSWKAFSRNLKELRILFCQTSPVSAPTRSFVETNYKELKTVNPKLPILIRECSGTEPQLWARYDFGVEKAIRLEGLTEQQISQVLEQLAKAATSPKA